MRIENDIKLDFNDVLLRPKRSMLKSKNDITLQREFTFKYSPHTWKGIPIIASPMDGVGTFSMAKVLQDVKMITSIKNGYSIEQWEEANEYLDFDYIAPRVGTGYAFDKNAIDYIKLKLILKEFPDIKMIVIDVANFYLQSSTDFLKLLRDDFPEHIVICGNVATPDISEQLIFDGADVVRIGIGPSSICTTRIKAGVGYPQLSAINECSDVVHGIQGHIVGDGGCTSPGDIAKAFGVGADFVMLGSMLAAHAESEERVVSAANKNYIRFWGMSSQAARERHGSRKDLYQSDEGRVVLLPFRGIVINTIKDILGGLASSMVYIGAKRLKDIPKCATFIRVSNKQTYNTSLEQYTEL